MIKFDIKPAEYNEIAEQIASEESVVGIDAKKTHILILHLLVDMQKRMKQLEERLISIENKRS